jgi:hypothetical protein
VRRRTLPVTCPGSSPPCGIHGFYCRKSLRHPADTIEKGKWYFERVENVTGKRFDHLDPGFGARMKWGAAAAQRELYQKLTALL